MGAPLAVLREAIEDRLVNHGGGAAVGGPGRARGRRSRRLRLVIHDAHINQRSNWANSVLSRVIYFARWFRMYAYFTSKANV